MQPTYRRAKEKLGPLKGEATESRVARAEQLMTRTARAAIDGLRLAAALGDAAREELDAAMAELRAVDAEECG